MKGTFKDWVDYEIYKENFNEMNSNCLVENKNYNESESLTQKFKELMSLFIKKIKSILGR